MAKIYLDATNAEYNINNNNDDVIGLVGTQSVALASGVTGVTVDQNVEEVVFAGAASDYTFLQSGNSIKVYANDSLVSTVFVQGDADGTQLSFSNGTADAILAGGVLTLGGATVDANVATHVNATLDTTNIPPTANSGLNLTTDQDALVGGAGDDTFTSDIFDNQNTFQSGDRINGGGGTDTLNAEIGNSQDFAISAKTTSVENMFFQAQARATDSSDNFISADLPPIITDLVANITAMGIEGYQEELAGISAIMKMINGPGGPLGDLGYDFSYRDANRDGYSQIDAGDMDGVRQLWSDDSRANLVIEDVSENSHTTTIGMRDTDPGNVNYEVYFDPQNITGPGNDAEGATLTIRLADVLDLGKGGDGLSNLPYDGFTLDIGGTAVKLDIDFSLLTSYADFKTAIEAALAAKGITSITVEQSPFETAVFSITVTDEGTTYLQGTVGGLYAPIVLTNTGAENLSLTSYTLDPGSQEPSGNLVRTASNNEASEIPSLTQVDVVLDNVARGDASGSGDLVIGDMSESGIQQFNVEVQHTSHIDQLASTNNVLEVVNVVNGSVDRAVTKNSVAEAIANEGNLTINRLDDVRVFDASAMTGDVNLGAFLSGNVTDKYLDLQDIQTNPAGDNSEIPYLNVVDTEFSYDMGAGDDTLDLAISSSNLAEAGTTNREDFVLEIQGNAGDDDITLAIVDEDDGDLASDGAIGINPVTTANWYDNSTLNANLTIDAGAGDDTIRIPGSGNVVIEAGSGNDTVYADNTGDKAVFVFNVEPDFSSIRADIENLQSDANDTYRIFKGTLTVNFKGFNVTVDLPNTLGVVSDLQVNQAIKNAINNDDVLSKLLVANDGPANTLVVSSLIDSEFGQDDVADLAISINVPTTLSSADTTLLNSYYGTPNGVAGDHIATFLAAQAAFEDNGDYDTQLAYFDGDEIVGSFSIHTSDNIITGDTGNDVIVLGTGAMSNDTIVYEGYDQTGNGLNDNDTIVNFVSSDFVLEPEVLTNLATVIDVTDGTDATPAVVAVAEVFTLTLTGSVATAAGSIALDGADFNGGGVDIVINPIAGQTLLDVAAALVAANNGAATPEWNAVNNLDGTVTFTALAAGAQNITIGQTIADSIAYDLSGVGMTLAVGTDGVTAVGVGAGTAESFDVEFSDATVDATYTFAGISVDVLAGETGTNIAASFAAATSDYVGWTASVNTLNVVTFTNDVVGDQTDITDASFVGANVVVTPETIVYGLPANFDMIDFSSYDVDSVYVDSDFTFGDIVGDGLLAANEDYVYMVESSTNDGVYTMYLMNTGSAAGFGGLTLDVTVGVIGVADFGVEQDFVADNFII